MDDINTYKRGTHLYIYGTTLSLSGCLRQCDQHGPTHYLHVYADKLELGEFNVIDVTSSPLKTLHIFARDFLPGTTDLQITGKDKALRMFIFNEEAPECLAITSGSQGVAGAKCEILRATSSCPLEAQGQPCEKIHSRLSDLDTGREIIISHDRAEIRPIRNVSRLELASPSYEDIQAFPGVEKAGQLPSPKIYRFPGGQGGNMRSFYVPILQPNYITERIKDRIERAADMEKTIDEIEQNELLHSSLQSSSQKIIEAIKYTMTSFVDIDKTKESAIEAIEDLERKRRDLQNASGSAKTKAHDLAVATETYKAEQDLKALLKTVAIGAEIVVGVGVAVATCGTGAPLTAVTAADAVKKAQELSKLSKAWNALKKLGELAGKMSPKLEAAHASQKSYLVVVSSLDLTSHGADAKLKQSALAGLTQVAKKVTADSLPNKEMETVDFLGIMADWDEIEVVIDRVFREAREGFKKGEELPQLGDFEVEMRKQVIRGRTVLKAMSKAQSAAQLYYRQLAEKAARDAITEKISILGQTEQDHARHIAKRYFSQALVDIKRSVFVLFHECILSMMYYENKGSFPIDNDGQEWFKGLGADIAIDRGLKSSFMHFYERLMDLYKNAVGRHIDQIFPGEISVDTLTHTGTVFDEVWKTDLVENKQMAFHIPTDLDQVEGFRRIRIKSLWASFDGLVGPNGDSSKVRYYFILGPRNIDISSEWEQVQYYIPAFALEKQGKDGELLNTQGALVRPALFCHGALGFAPHHLKGMDLSTVTRVTIHFTCEAVSKLQS
ncbi:hypothetical protein FBEOM_5870 [Fusarium beomiforme]|uniref:Uncharacterized protein n=1 Tax=Fusarium beomiforme TaxID=44412 RepID=A0A9P5AK53_9HYPO|nr:hypothetical protein FBEOM_5870 [Fusarium beomiforme]